ncbi:unnamed protein product [Dimorphilus gyrociliatus]|uniref:Uncharacterized protein n=1 Tax=Dimorphilus gyrociliatus TaxID=2664684 RepID=A0A7I8WD15_9ANNE|nr:unnamed protein product [Dimorphilus gyrociliatus]
MLLCRNNNDTVTVKLEYPEEEPFYNSIMETGSECSVRNPPAGSSHNVSMDRELDYRFVRNNNNNNDYAPVIKAYRKSRSVSNLLNQSDSSSRTLKTTPLPSLRFKRRSNSASNVLEMDIPTSGSVHHIPLNNGKFLSISIHDNSATPLLSNGERHEDAPDLPEDNFSAISDLSNVTSVSQMASKSLQPQLSIVRETPKDTQHELGV